MLCTTEFCPCKHGFIYYSYNCCAHKFLHHACVCGAGACDTLASEQLDFVGFPCFFMNGMNNYPGVAANSEESSQTLPSYRPQPTRRKTCRNTHQIPALYSLALRLSLCLSLVFSLCVFLSFGLFCPGVSLKLVFFLISLYNSHAFSLPFFSIYLFVLPLFFWFTQILGCKTSYNMRGSY